MRHMFHRLLLIVFAINMCGNVLNYTSSAAGKKHMHDPLPIENHKNSCSDNHCHQSGIFGHSSHQISIPTLTDIENLTPTIERKYLLNKKPTYIASHLLDGPYKPPC